MEKPRDNQLMYVFFKFKQKTLARDRTQAPYQRVSNNACDTSSNKTSTHFTFSKAARRYETTITA